MIFFNKFSRFHKSNFLRNPIDSFEFYKLSKNVRNQINIPNYNLYNYFIISPYKKSYDKIRNINNIKVIYKGEIWIQYYQF
jgi:hypothetical protein